MRVHFLAVHGEAVMSDQSVPTGARAEGDDHNAIGVALDAERRIAGRLSDVREAIFGAQDGLVSTLAIVSTVSGATDDRFPVLIAGIGAALGGIFSMAAGEYLSSKSQREIALARIADERDKVASRRPQVQAELAYLLTEDGLPDDDAQRIAETMARYPEVLLTNKAEKEFGIAIEEAEGSPLQGAMVMGIAFGLGALAPILPYVFLPVDVAVYMSVVATAAVLFAIGVIKTRWTHANPMWSGTEILLVGAIAGIVGYLFGNVLPPLLGAPAVSG